MNGGWLPLAVHLVVDLEFTAFELLLMGASIETAVLLSEIPTGVIADVFSRKWSVVLGSLFLSCAQLASGVVDQWFMFMITQFVWGIGWTFISGAEVAWVTDELGGDPEAAAPLILRRGRLSLIATVAGTVVFGALTMLVPLAVTVIVAGAIGLVWTLVLAAIMQETGFERTDKHRWVTFVATFRAGARWTWQQRGLRVLGATLVMAGIATEAIDRAQLRRFEDLGLSDELSPVLVFGAVIIVESLVGALLLWLTASRLSGSNVVRGFAVILGLAGLAALLAAHVAILPVALVVLSAQGGLLSVSEPLTEAWANALAPSGARATVHSFIGQTRAFGEIVGGIGLGAVAHIFTLPVAWTIAAGLFIIASAYARTATRSWEAA